MYNVCVVYMLYIYIYIYINTVEPRYLELPAISNLNPFSLDLPLIFHLFVLGYLRELGYLKLPAISNYFLFPLAQINPGYLKI